MRSRVAQQRPTPYPVCKATVQEPVLASSQEGKEVRGGVTVKTRVIHGRRCVWDKGKRGYAELFDPEDHSGVGDTPRTDYALYRWNRRRRVWVDEVARERRRQVRHSWGQEHRRRRRRRWQQRHLNRTLRKVFLVGVAAAVIAILGEIYGWWS